MYSVFCIIRGVHDGGTPFALRKCPTLVPLLPLVNPLCLPLTPPPPRSKTRTKKQHKPRVLPTRQVEESARRQDAERTSIAQARAQSATELSTSRRLKAELARTFAAQQRRAAGTFDVCPPTPIVSHASLVRHGLRDAGVGIGVGLDRRGFSGEGGATVSTASREATTGIRGGGEKTLSQQITQDAEVD